jgi:hypothetical protein
VPGLIKINHLVQTLLGKQAHKSSNEIVITDTYISKMKFEFFMAVKMWIVFWVVTPRSLVDRYQLLERMHCLHRHCVVVETRINIFTCYIHSSRRVLPRVLVYVIKKPWKGGQRSVLDYKRVWRNGLVTLGMQAERVTLIHICQWNISSSSQGKENVNVVFCPKIMRGEIISMQQTYFRSNFCVLWVMKFSRRCWNVC